MNENITKFLEQDDIDMSKFLANSEIIKNETKEIYQATAKLHSQADISSDATKTIHWMALPYNQPLGYPKWFITAYPDVVRWFSDKEEEEMIPIIGNLSQDCLGEDSYLRLPILRKLVDAYKNINDLECC